MPKFLMNIDFVDENELMNKLVRLETLAREINSIISDIRRSIEVSATTIKKATAKEEQ